MATPAQIMANQANAQHSTGPRTEAGKARASQNARSHGLTARDVVVFEHDREEFEQLSASFTADLAPEGEIELQLFHGIVRAAWNLRRIPRLEAALAAQSAQAAGRGAQRNRNSADLALAGESVVREFLESGTDPLLDPTLAPQADRLQRHYRANESSFHRNRKALQGQQTLRAQRATLPEQNEANLPPQADPAAVTAQEEAAGIGRLIRRAASGMDAELKLHRVVRKVWEASLTSEQNGEAPEQNEPNPPSEMPMQNEAPIQNDAPVQNEPVSSVPFRRPSPKVGRNEPCPCGSGRKFKRCCLHTAA